MREGSPGASNPQLPRMNLHWALNRLRAMGPREIGHRGRQYLSARLERAGVGLVKPLAPSALRGQAWTSVMPQDFDTAIYTAAAERILSGQFRLFGHREWPLGMPPEWNRDPVTGTRAPLAFGKTLNYRDAQRIGNIKYLWEPNRHLELVTLAQAWRLSGDPRFALGCRTLVDSWITQCPYMLGPNWTSSLELALRLANWSCCWHLLGGDGALVFEGEEGAAFKARWLTAVRQHCHFIARHPSLYSSANNHLLGELFGLFVAATTWPCWPESAAWRTQARRELEVQALLQNAPDGVNKEHALWYQHEVADMMLLAGLTARANDCDFSPPFWARLESMLEFIAACMDVGGNVPALGDADDAVMVRFCPQADFAVYRSLLASGAVLFARADFKHKAHVLDDKSRWLLGDAAAASFADLEVHGSPQPPRRAFASGYYVLGSDFDSPREVRLIADAAPLGYLAIAAHGHADALSFTLSVGGRPLLIDPGTYCYHTERRWREYFRGTSAHNTVRVDAVDQSVSGGPFLWTQRANARCVSFESGVESDRLIAEHDGYTRLADPVLHRREILYVRSAALIRVTDHIHCRSEHRLEMFWHFAPDCAVTLGDAVASIVSGPVTVTLRWPEPFEAELVRGREAPALGWYSARFDEKVPTSTLVVRGRVQGDWRGVTTLAQSSG
jgi:hypothetical protein